LIMGVRFHHALYACAYCDCHPDIGYYVAEQMSGLLSANLKALCNFRCTFTVNTEAVLTLSYGFNSLWWDHLSQVRSPHVWGVRQKSYLRQGERN
jgi:hypothetical protein